MATTTFLEAGTDATQDLSFFPFTTLTNGTVSSDNTQSEDGPRSLKSDVTVSAGQACVTTPNGSIADSGALFSGWFRFSTGTPATLTLFLGAYQSNNGSMILGCGLNTNGTLHFGGRGTTFKDGVTVLSANTWYRISVGYIITTSTNWSAILYINGVQELSVSNTDGTLSLTSTSGVGYGITSSSQGGFTTPAVMTVWIDSMYIDNRTDKSDCGNVHVTAKRPFSNGTTNNFNTQIGSGGSGYGTGHSPQVNEQPLNTTNGWSVVAVAATTEEYNIESAATGDVNISAATLIDYMGWVYYKTVLGETPSIVVNGVNTAFTSATNANTMQTKAAGSTTYPASTGTDVGMISDATATTVSLFEAGIIFAYIPATTSSFTFTNPKLKALQLLGIGT